MDLAFHAPVLAILISITGAFTIPVISTVARRRYYELYALVITGTVFSMTLLTCLRVFTMGKIIYMLAGWPPPVGITYVVDSYGALVGVLIGGISFLITVYSIKYMEIDYGVQWYYTLVLAMITGLLGICYTGDLFHLFVMLSLMGIPSFLLVAFRKDKKQAVEAGMKYAIYDILAMTTYYLSLAYIFGLFGTVNMAEVSAKLDGYISPLSGGIFGDISKLAVVLALIVWALAIASALVPVHFWLPDAHSMAPSSISALLSALVVQTSLFVLARLLFTVFHSHTNQNGEIVLLLLLAMGVASTLYGSIMMLVQTDLKRLIAYSTVLNVGLVSIGFAVATPLGVMAAIFHLINHAIVKSALFLTAGSFIHSTGSRNISDYMGIAKKMPRSAFLYTFGALAAIGMPPLSIMWSKLFILASLLERGGFYVAIMALVLLAIVFEAVAQIKVISRFYGSAISEGQSSGDGSVVPAKIHESSKIMLAPIAVLIFIAVITGLFPGFLSGLAQNAASSLLDASGYYEPTLRTIELVLGK